MLPPPPPYVEDGPLSPPPFPSQNRPRPSLVTLPPHILLRIVYETFSNGPVKSQRKVLYWLTMNLRLVNRALYIACMHVLRSTYLPAPSSLLPTQSIQRETCVLDLFIALKVREDVWADESELHLEREGSFKDLFDLMQPRARLEDLVRVYGTREGVISLFSSSSSAGTPVISSPSPKKGMSGSMDSRKTNGSTSRVRSSAVPFSALSVSFSPRTVGLVLTTKERKKTIVQVPRTKEESLELSARRLVAELKGWVVANHGV
ncbi:hypothetical protein BD414DRAFT_513903 [Trametes punicea]|nr:hypothetical protein BD414DRAFT_513903 [Trametes punicea]